MKFYRKIRNWGNSKGIVIPAEILNTLNLKAGDELTLHLDDSHIIMEKTVKK